MKIIEQSLHIGADVPFVFIHATDTHLTLADDRNCERKRALSEKRSKAYSDSENSLRELEQLAREKNALIVHTGDMIDFVSYANLDRAKEFVTHNDVFFVAGNHEFSLFVGDAFEDAAYRNQSLDLVQAHFQNNIRFASRKVNGINFIGIDNGYYQIDQAQLDALQQEAALGLPIILCMHNPLHQQELFDETMKQGAEAAYLVASPDAQIRGYKEERYRQQKADETTLNAVAYIKSCPLIKALFVGHLHKNREHMLTDTIPQFVTGLSTARIVSVF